MCGIIGTIQRNAATFITPATHSIAHRGPDDTGFFTEDNLAFGFQRLAIQDLSVNGHQPMVSADGNYIIIFNGEIYNHLDVKVDLQDKYPFKSTSDTETILYGYIEYGAEIVNKLNGIFAFSIYDRKKKEVFIARDHFGVKPLYYYSDDNCFMWGSEIKSFLNYADLDKEIDHTALVNYLTFLYSPGEQTPFKKVKKLLSGHYIKISLDNPKAFKITKYYDIPLNNTQYSTKSEKELVDELEARLLKAVERQLLSDVPVGFFLSGGIDSSAVVAMARKLMPDKALKCYTIDTGQSEEMGDGFVSDLPYAIRVAKILNVDLEIVEAKQDIVRDFDKMIWHLDEPQADPAPLNVLNICRKAREEGCVVLLGGSAGDDLFSGYRRHQAIYYHEKYLRYIPNFLSPIIQSFAKRLNASSPFQRRAKKLISGVGNDFIEKMYNFFTWLSLDKIRPLFNTKVRAQIDNYEPKSIFMDALNNIPNQKNRLNQMLYWEMKYFLTDHNLNYTDKLSMATGVEVRVPFLDKELVEFSTLIPPHLKMKGVTTKYLLKKMMERYLPHDIIYRSKAGFGAPVREWITKDLKPTIEHYLSKESIEKRGIFDYNAVKTLINDNKSGKIDASYSIWCLLAIESWFRQFVSPFQDI
jgi:asparagine synthase (glutamine-hydrolysing)